MPKERLDQPERNGTYQAQLSIIENLCNSAHINHRFVGGTFTDFLGPKTSASVDFDRRIVQLKNYIFAQGLRSDETHKDVDLIAFCPDSSRFEKTRRFLKTHPFFPSISIEPARFPDYPKRNELLQFVSGIDVDENEHYYLTFDKIRQRVDPKTFEPWKVVLIGNDELRSPEFSLTVLNPFAHALRYCMRVPSGVKKKDKERPEEGLSKMSLLMTLGMQVAREAQKYGIDYRHDLYKPWIDFIRLMKRDQSTTIALKRMLTGNYWNSIGTAVAHGQGIFKPLAELGDRFSA